MNRINLTVLGAAALLAGVAQAATYTDPVPVSNQVPDGQQAYKAKMVSQVYKSDAGLATYDVRPTVIVYADNAEAGGQDLWIARSINNGATWSYTRLTHNAGTAVSLVGPDGNNYVLPSSNAKPNIYAPATGSIVNGHGANMLVTWGSSYCRDLADPSQPSPVQKVNLNLDTGPALYQCLWTARSVDGGVTWASSQVTDGAKDVDEDVPAGYTTSNLASGGFGIVWQADPAGLKQGGGEGDGDGASGASVSKGTNIWYTFLNKQNFEAGVPFPTPQVPLSDNDPVTNPMGASRPNLFIVGGTAVVAYEETKGNSDLFGKQILYHSFPYATPDANSAGTVVSDPAVNARRVRILSQGDASAGASPLRVVLLYRQSTKAAPAAPAQVIVQRGLKTAEVGSTGFRAVDIEPFSAAVNLSKAILDKKTTNALAQRGVLRGGHVAVGFDFTRDVTKATAVPPEATYNFFVATSLDSGATWHAPINISKITDNNIRAVEPRLVGTPGTILNPDGTPTGDPRDVQATETLFLAYGTETNAAVSIPLDISVRRSIDFGATLLRTTPLAVGPTAQSEVQIKVTPDGLATQALWMQDDGTATDVYFTTGVYR